MNEFVFNLYDAAGTLLSTSGAQYNSSNALPLDISYLFTGLADQTAYSIECTADTTGGRQLTTGKVNFTTAYTQPSLYSYIYLTNKCQEGYITIDCNVIAIIGKIDGCGKFTRHVKIKYNTYTKSSLRRCGACISENNVQEISTFGRYFGVITRAPVRGNIIE